MKDIAEGKIRPPRGAGYGIGFIVGTLVAVGFVAITGVEALVGTVAASVTFSAGLFLEQKLQGKRPAITPGGKRLSVAFLVLGVLFFMLALVCVV